jgi:hypothetical protein
MFYGRPYLDAINFAQLLNSQDQLAGQQQTIDVYFFECALDDCGWGTIKNQPELNTSMETFVDTFEKQGVLVTEISEPIADGSYFPFSSPDKKRTVLKIYRAQVPMKPAVLNYANQPKQWFLYTIGFFPLESNFDYVVPDGAFETLLFKFARLIVYVALIGAVLSIIYSILLLFEAEKTKENS